MSDLRSIGLLSAARDIKPQVKGHLLPPRILASCLVAQRSDWIYDNALLGPPTALASPQVG
jgi:hypothetical protein